MVENVDRYKNNYYIVDRFDHMLKL